MPAFDTALPFRIGARTLLTLRRRLVRHRLSLDEALIGRAPTLPPLESGDHGYLVTLLPEEWRSALVDRHPGVKAFVRQRYRRCYARLDQDFETYFAGFSAKSRSTLKRKAKKLAERSGGTLDIRCYRDEAEAALFHETARALSARTYQERLLDAGLPDGPEALGEMCALARRGQMRGWLLFLDERPIAYLYAPAEGETLIYAHLGYDPEFAEYSPGTVLQLEAMRELMAQKAFRLFDFTEGQGQHKRLFATGEIECVDLLLLRPTATNLLTGHVLNAFDSTVALAKEAVRALAPPRAARRLGR